MLKYSAKVEMTISCPVDCPVKFEMLLSDPQYVDGIRFYNELYRQIEHLGIRHKQGLVVTLMFNLVILNKMFSKHLQIMSLFKTKYFL